MVAVPKPKQQMRTEECERCESQPWLEQDQRANIEGRDISKQRSILIAIRAQKDGSEEAANQRHDRNARRIVKQSQSGSLGNQDRQISERGLLCDQVVV